MGEASYTRREERRTLTELARSGKPTQRLSTGTVLSSGAGGATTMLGSHRFRGSLADDDKQCKQALAAAQSRVTGGFEASHRLADASDTASRRWLYNAGGLSRYNSNSVLSPFPFNAWKTDTSSPCWRGCTSPSSRSGRSRPMAVAGSAAGGTSTARPRFRDAEGRGRCCFAGRVAGPGRA